MTQTDRHSPNAHSSAFTLEATLTPLKPALCASGDGNLEVLLRLKAQGREGVQAPRTPLSLSLVIDRSGSMAGENLEAAKACVEDLVRRLQPQDEVGIVIYDDAVQELMPVMAARQAQDRVAALMQSFTDGGSTALYDGWLKGAQQLASRTGGNRLCRVILLSDGQANRGLVEEDEICERVRQMAQAGVSTTTVGLGEGFNESLMTRMARAGQGNALYGDRAQDLSESFEMEIGLLSHLAWREVRLVSGSATSRWKLRNDYPKTADGAWILPHLAAQSEAWAVFTAPMDSVDRAQTRSRQGRALHITVTAQDATGQPIKITASLEALPVVPDQQWHQMPEDEMVARRVAELRAAELQREARAAVEQGRWSEAERLLQRAQALAADQPWVQGVVANLQELVKRRERMRFGKEAVYASVRMSSRLAAIDEEATFSESMEIERPVYLRKKVVQGRASGG